MSKADASVTQALHAWCVQQGAGVSVAETLTMCAPLCSQPAARNCFLEAAARAERGESIERLLDALAPLLSEAERAALAAGWNGGRAEAILGTVVAQRELWETARAKIRAKLIMPALVLGLASFIGPLPHFISGGSMTVYFISALAPLACAFFFWRLGAQMFRRQRAFDHWKLSLPILREVERNRNLAEFSTYLSNLLAAGLTASDALQTCARTASNEVYAQAIAASAAVVRSGNPLSATLAPSPLWPLEFIAAIKVGEQSGSLDEVLARMANDYRERYVRAVEAFAEWLPWLIYALIAIFVIILIFILAAGIFSIYNSFGVP